MASAIHPARGAMVAVALIPALLVAQLGDAQGARTHRRASTCKAGKAPALVQMGQALTLKGTIKPKKARAVKAQLFSNKRWRTVARGRSAKRTGAFRLKLNLTAGGVSRVRAYAPRTRRLAAAACKAEKITVHAPDGSTTAA